MVARPTSQSELCTAHRGACAIRHAGAQASGSELEQGQRERPCCGGVQHPSAHCSIPKGVAASCTGSVAAAVRWG